MTVTSESDGGGGPLPAPQFFCLTPTLLAIFFLAPTLHCWRPKTREYDHSLSQNCQNYACIAGYTMYQNYILYLSFLPSLCISYFLF